MDQQKTHTPKRDQTETARRETPVHTRAEEPLDETRHHRTTRDQGRQDMPSGTQPGEKGRGTQSERNRGGGISNRDIDREMEEQDELPGRGQRQSER